jgi:hypothetical protein
MTNKELREYFALQNIDVKDSVIDGADGIKTSLLVLAAIDEQCPTLFEKYNPSQIAINKYLNSIKRVEKSFIKNISPFLLTLRIEMRKVALNNYPELTEDDLKSMTIESINETYLSDTPGYEFQKIINIISRKIENGTLSFEVADDLLLLMETNIEDMSDSGKYVYDIFLDSIIEFKKSFDKS